MTKQTLSCSAVFYQDLCIAFGLRASEACTSGLEARIEQLTSIETHRVVDALIRADPYDWAGRALRVSTIKSNDGAERLVLFDGQPVIRLHPVYIEKGLASDRDYGVIKVTATRVFEVLPT